jgi:hypothetical protein
LVVAVPAAPFAVFLVVEEAVGLPVLEAEATDAVLRTGLGVTVLVVEPMTDPRVRVVEAVGEVAFLALAAVEVDVAAIARVAVEGTVDFRVKLGVVEVVEVTEALLLTPGVAVARVVVVVVPVLVPTEGVLEARTELVVVGLAAVEPILVRDVTAGFVAVDAADDLVIGVLEVVVVAAFLTFEAGEAVPASPAAAKEDIRLFTLRGLSVIINSQGGITFLGGNKISGCGIER